METKRVPEGEIVYKSGEELKGIAGDAWSIGAYNIPVEPVKYLGSVKKKNDTTHYYRDSTGKYFYESERILRFDREMKEAQKRRRKNHRKQTA